MSHLHVPRILPAAAHQEPSPDQQKFNTLVGQIGEARANLQAWQAGIADFRKGYAQKLLPLQAQLAAAWRQWAFALDAATGWPAWTRAERDTLGELVREAAGELLAAGDADAELHALFARHAEVGSRARRPQEVPSSGDSAREPEDDALSDEEFLRRLDSQMEQQAAADALRREQQKAARRKTGARQRREQEQRETSQSLRAVFRKLASALHPDRETDAAARAAKTALMQQVNQAYARADLLALLELQLRIEQVDAAHMANMDARRLGHYNQVLADQLEELRAEIRRVGTAFSMDFGLASAGPLHPGKLGELLQRQARSLRGELAQVQLRERMLRDPAATRRWLRAERQRLRQADPGSGLS